MSGRGIRPPWWDWELFLTKPVQRRMVQRGLSETDLRTMMEDAVAVIPDRRSWRRLVQTVRGSEQWEIVLDPNPDLRVLVVVTAYKI